jgi:zinc transport system ATP-binding protein
MTTTRSDLAAAPVLRCRGLAVGHRGHAVLSSIDVDVRRGEMLLVVGRNGAGKSTLLRTMLGLLRPIAGQIERATPPPRLAYVPQASGLDAVVPVRGRDVAAWGRLRGWQFLWPLPRKDDRAAVSQALADAGAAGFAARPFRELSGGQQQRILLSRVLAGDADLAILDEPTASLDAVAERAAYARLAELAHDRGLAVVAVTHTLHASIALADAVLFVEPPDVAVHGTPAEVCAHPAFVSLFGEIHLHADLG